MRDKDEKKESIVKEMDKIMSQNDITYGDGQFIQLGFLFSSWKNFFISVKKHPYFMVSILINLILIISASFFSGQIIEQTMQDTNTVVEENIRYYNEDGDQISESIIHGLGSFNIKSTTYVIAQIVLLVFLLILNAVVLYIFAQIGGIHDPDFLKIISATLGFGIFANIYKLIYAIVTYITGITIDVFSLGVFAVNTSVMNPRYALFSSINALLVFKVVFIYYMFVNLFDCSKHKSMTFSLITCSIFILGNFIIIILTSLFISSLISSSVM
ncbi:MAG: hypothetical protein ACK5LV_01200 [Lachnospirales bacterium]